jgi:O-antigen ligase/polysaccharide polymerase Wzy-like membrane protein
MGHARRRGGTLTVGTALEFRLRRSVLQIYGVLALVLSAALLLSSRERGPREFSSWLAVYVALGVVSIRWPKVAPLAGGLSAFLLGWVRTYCGGINLDLGLGLIALSVGVWVLRRASRGHVSPSLDLAGLSLLSIAGWSSISLVFAVFRIRSFRPAPGFDYEVYQLNAFGFSSDEALLRATLSATAMFLAFGLFLYARSGDLPEGKALNVAVFLALLVNGAALVVQRNLDPGFLHPAGSVPFERQNGVTSFCYALGDAVLAIYLLLPAWGVARGRLGVLTAGSVVLLAYALLASGSRTALFTVIAATMLWACLRAVRQSRARRHAAAYVSLATMALLLCVAMAAYRATPPDGATPFGRLKAGIEAHGGLLGHLFVTRLHAYPLAFRVIAEYPLSGVGAGLYLEEFSKQRALLAPELKVLESYLMTSYAPNQFLNTGVELGLPALIALVVAFVSAAAAALRGPGEGSGELVVSLLGLAGALQFGPTFYNSEALVFCWMIVGLAARAGSVSGSEPALPSRVVGSRASAALVAGVIVVGIAGQMLSLPSLAVDHQWKRLRWRLGIGMLPREADGRWTRPQATFSVDTPATAVIVRWHAGDAAVPDYRGEVSFFVDGALVERSIAVSGRGRESILPLPAVAGFKRISVRVNPPFVPAEYEGEDRRRLGIFLHSVTPQP